MYRGADWVLVPRPPFTAQTKLGVDCSTFLQSQNVARRFFAVGGISAELCRADCVRPPKKLKPWDSAGARGLDLARSRAEVRSTKRQRATLP